MKVMSSEKLNTEGGVIKQEKWKEAEAWDYDAAISATGYGSYNINLLLSFIPPLVAALFCTSTMSYILPSAECDLNLTNFDKGLLNAIPYVGMILTGFLWGFMADTFGRQKLLVVGLVLDAVFNITAGLVQSFPALLVAKLLDGLVCAGPYSVVLTYLAECNPDNQRSQIIQVSGVITAAGTCILPMLAWAILPLEIDQPWPSTFEIPAWRLFLLISTLPGIMAAIIFYFRWESPKFLLAQGRNDEALECLRQMYMINTKNPGYTFPVTALKSEKHESDVQNKSIGSALCQGLKQVVPLFQPPYVSRAFLIFMFQFGALFGYNTIRLWMPQLFATILNAESHGVENATSVCDLFAADTGSSSTGLVCPSEPVDDNVYLNSILLGMITGVIFMVCGYVTRYIGDRILIMAAVALSVVSCMAMYWGVSSTLMLLFGGLFVAATSVSSTAILSVTLRLFPTEVRTMAVSLTMMFGQIGGTLGNILFPVLLDWSCEVPFFALAAILLLTGLLILFVPKDEEPTEKCNV